MGRGSCAHRLDSLRMILVMVLSNWCMVWKWLAFFSDHGSYLRLTKHLWRCYLVDLAQRLISRCNFCFTSYWWHKVLLRNLPTSYGWPLTLTQVVRLKSNYVTIRLWVAIELLLDQDLLCWHIVENHGTVVWVWEQVRLKLTLLEALSELLGASLLVADRRGCLWALLDQGIGVGQVGCLNALMTTG